MIVYGVSLTAIAKGRLLNGPFHSIAHAQTYTRDTEELQKRIVKSAAASVSEDLPLIWTMMLFL